MTRILDDNKNVIIKKNKVICKVVIEDVLFNKNKNVNVNSPERFFKSPERFFIEPKEFVGVATLKEGDTDNLRDAIHIAESKMERQYYKYILHCFKEEKEHLSRYINSIDVCIKKNTNNVESIDSHIKDIVNSMK
jgi:hypothetical protein